MKVNEIAFRLSKDCDLYKQCMEAWEQKKKINERVKEFSVKHFGTDRITYRLCKTFYCNIEAPGQVCKKKQGACYRYKANSPLQKAWTSEVVEKSDFKKLDILDFWYWGCINKGSYSIWKHKETVYGYLSSDYEKPVLPDGAEEIKMSEYYQIIEEIEGKNAE